MKAYEAFSSWVRSAIGWPCLSVVGVGLGLFLDVLVEGAAGVGHEHGVERGRQALAGDEPLEALRRVLDDGPAVVEHGDPLAQAIGLVEVMGGQDDRSVVALAD